MISPFSGEREAQTVRLSDWLLSIFLRFYEPVSFQPNIIPICVPEDDADLVGKEAWVTGWGRLYEGKEDYKL